MWALLVFPLAAIFWMLLLDRLGVQFRDPGVGQ